MPIYEYGCKNCGHVLDALQKMSDDPLVDCPECEKPELKRRISAPRFRLKGEGWYETDFKKDNQRNLAKSDSESAGKTDKAEKGDKADKSDKSDGKKESAKPESASKKSTDSKSDGGTSAAAK